MARILPDIKISREELKKIAINQNNYDHGAEGIIIKGQNKRNVRKLFYNELGLIYPIDEQTEYIRENKLNKLTKLYQIENFDNDVKVCATVSCDGQLVGYDMVSQRINYPYIITALSNDDKIRFLKQIKKKLEYFHSLKIVYGDVRVDNILIDKRKKHISFCDLDNIQIDSYPIDCMSYYIADMCMKDSLLDKSADCYMYNLLLLKELLYKYYDYEHILENIPKDIVTNLNTFNEKGIENIKKMINMKNRYNGGYLIDNLKK